MTKEKLNICICGGGNMGHALAGILGSRDDLEISILTRQVTAWEKKVTVTLNNGERLQGVLQCITDDPSEVIPQSDLIFITVPSFAMYEVLERISPYTCQDTWIGALPGTGGFDWMAYDLFKEQIQLFGLQRVPYIARTTEYGREVNVTGIKEKLYVSSIPNFKVHEIASILTYVFQKPIVELNNYLEVTLTTSNPILHPSRLYALFHDYEEGDFWEERIPFYESWDLHASEILLRCDKEVQEICSRIPLNISHVLPLTKHYEVSDEYEMTKKISSISAFKGIYTPMRLMEKGYVPDFSSRYFTEDISYGLVIIKGIAELFDCPTPTIDKVLTWAQTMMEKEFLVGGKLEGKNLWETGAPQCFGITKRDDLVQHALR